MAATIEQAVQVLQLQLSEANAQIGLMTVALDTLRTESVAALQDLRRRLTSAEAKGGKQKDVQFINTKTFEGGKFGGTSKESFKAWSKTLKVYLNSIRSGMRQALEASEESDVKMDMQSLKGIGWPEAVEANEKLYDFLMTFAADEALRVVEPYEGEGFEAYRQLKRRYTLVGGTSEVDRTIKLFNKKACKNLSDLPAAIDILDKELRKDEDASGHRMPDHTKIALLVRLFPEKDEKDLKHRFVHGQKSFEKVRAEIMAVAVNERLETTTRGVRDMEVDALADHKNQEAEESYTAKEWFDWVQEEEQVDYMGKGKGKGKGKSKGGWRTPGQWSDKGCDKDGKGDGRGKGKGKGKETRICHHCKKAGHLIADCRAKAGGQHRGRVGRRLRLLLPVRRAQRG